MTDVHDRLAAALADRYRVERELGAGGMATVYLAHDLKHDRDVAIKVLHPDLGAALGADRFLSEIRTTARLQHPHILPLLDSGDAGGLLYYVMPLVTGETLRTRLERERQLPIDDAVRIAREVADALGYAHGLGVIHRDIKPENILLQGGHALVADFGIALAVQQAGGQRMTQTGLSLGTPQYMSPEQAMGERTIDARSDIYALGAVTYEMLVGEPPFTGPSVQAIVARLVTEEPRALSAQRKAVPPEVENAVLHALEKLPADRCATAAEFAAELGDTRTTSQRTTRATVRPAGKKRSAPLALAVTAALLLGAAALWGWLRPQPAILPTRQRVILWATQYPDVLSPGTARLETRFAISPDGGTIAFTDSTGDESQLFVKQRNEARATPIAGTEGAAGPFFSPDGQWVGYFAHGGILRKLRVAGGGSVQVASAGVETYPVGTWLDDGSIVFADVNNALVRVSAEGGALTVLRPPSPTHHDDPTMLTALPGSHGILFTGCPGNCASGSAVYVFDVATKATRLLVPDAVGAWYSPTGYLLYTGRSGGLFAVGFDLKRMAVTSGAISIVDDVSPDGFVLSNTGTAILTLGTQNLKQSTLVWVSRDGTETPFATDWSGQFEYPAISPDGKNIAVSVRDNVTQLWIHRADGSRLKISKGDLGTWRPSWAADGQSFAFSTTAGTGSATGANDIYLSPIDGGTAPRLLVHMKAGVWEAELSRDGQWLAVREGDATLGDLYARRLDGDTALRLIHSDSSFNTSLAISPDSHWLAFTSDHSGRPEVYVASFPDMRIKYAISQGGGVEPRWSHSGRELFYKSHGKFMSLAVPAGGGFAPGNARPLFSAAPYTTATNRQEYDVAPDDNRFLMIRPPNRATQPDVVMVENFFAELRAKVKR